MGFIETLLVASGLILSIFLIIKCESVIPVNFLDRAERTFNDMGEFVEVKTNSYSRFYSFKGRVIRKSDIVRIQKAGCITLFTTSNNAIDITLHPSNRDKVFSRAKEIFKEASFVEINLGS